MQFRYGGELLEGGIFKVVGALMLILILMSTRSCGTALLAF